MGLSPFGLGKSHRLSGASSLASVMIFKASGESGIRLGCPFFNSLPYDDERCACANTAPQPTSTHVSTMSAVVRRAQDAAMVVPPTASGGRTKQAATSLDRDIEKPMPVAAPQVQATVRSMRCPVDSSNKFRSERAT